MNSRTALIIAAVVFLAWLYRDKLGLGGFFTKIGDEFQPDGTGETTVELPQEKVYNEPFDQPPLPPGYQFPEQEHDPWSQEQRAPSLYDQTDSGPPPEPTIPTTTPQLSALGIGGNATEPLRVKSTSGEILPVEWTAIPFNLVWSPATHGPPQHRATPDQVSRAEAAADWIYNYQMRLGAGPRGGFEFPTSWRTIIGPRTALARPVAVYYWNIGLYMDSLLIALPGDAARNTFKRRIAELINDLESAFAEIFSADPTALREEILRSIGGGS